MRKSQKLAKHPLVSAYNRFSVHKPKIHSCPTPLCFFYSLKSQQFTPNFNHRPGKEDKQSRIPPHAFLSHFKKLLSTHTAFYTDGSKADPGYYVGLAIYSPPPDNFKFLARISSLASIFSAEALAIQLTLEYIASSNLRKSVIFTDSLSTIQVLDNYSTFIPFTHATIFRIKNLLLEQNDQRKLIFLALIPSHKGIHGNEEVDTLAKQAIGSGLTLTFSDLYELSNSITNDKLQNFLRNSDPSKGNFFFDFIYSSQAKPWFHSRSLSRFQISSFCRMRSNHYNLAYSLFRRNLCESPTCSCSEDDETLNHVFWSCSKFNAQRTQLLRSLVKSKNVPPYTIT